MDSTQNLESQIFDMVTIYGTFWERLGASIIDGLILAVPSYLLNHYATIGVLFNIGPYYQLNIFVLIAGWLYYALQESGPKMGTVGKKALGLKVVNGEGGRISFMNATGRHFSKYVSEATIFIGYLMVLWDDKRQALHDKMAGTYVIKD